MIYTKGHLLVDGKYKANRLLTVVVSPQPKDYKKAMTQTKYIKSGATFQIKGTRKTEYMGIDGLDENGEPKRRKYHRLWYKTKGGFINEISLLGATIERL